jgi:hypothetical protein
LVITTILHWLCLQVCFLAFIGRQAAARGRIKCAKAPENTGALMCENSLEVSCCESEKISYHDTCMTLHHIWNIERGTIFCLTAFHIRRWRYLVRKQGLQMMHDERGPSRDFSTASANLNVAAPGCNQLVRPTPSQAPKLAALNGFKSLQASGLPG